MLLSALKEGYISNKYSKLAARIVHTMIAESDWVIVKIESRVPVIPRRETCGHSFLHKLHLITISAES